MHLVDVARVQPADREERHRARSPRRSAPARGRRPGGPPWSGSRAPGRRRCSRRAPDRRRRSRLGRAWRGRSACPGRRSRAPAPTGRSSWPTCTPSAPDLGRDAGAVVDDRTARRCARRAHARRARRPPARRRRGASRAAARCRRRRRQRRAAGRAAARRRRVAGQAAHEIQAARAPGARADPLRARSPGIAAESRMACSAHRSRVPDAARTSISRHAHVKAQRTCSIVGGGVIGLAIAWRARRARHDGRRCSSATALGEGTSRVAAGMLAPVAEVEFGGAGRRMLELALRSAALWPAFAAELSAASGDRDRAARRPARCCSRATPTRRASSSASSSSAARSGCDVRRLRPSEARELRAGARADPARCALEAPDDHSLDPRPVLAALREACERSGRAAPRAHGARGRSMHDGSRLAAVRARGRRAAVPPARWCSPPGPWSGRLAGLPGRRGRAGAPRQGPDPAPARSRPVPGCSNA